MERFIESSEIPVETALRLALTKLGKSGFLLGCQEVDNNGNGDSLPVVGDPRFLQEQSHV